MDAIAQGTSGTTTAILVAEIEKREQDLQEVAGHILEAEARVQPLLLPKPAAVEDYLVGSATLFDGEFQRERELLEQVVPPENLDPRGIIEVHLGLRHRFGPCSTCSAPCSSPLSRSWRRATSSPSRFLPCVTSSACSNGQSSGHV